LSPLIVKRDAPGSLETVVAEALSRCNMLVRGELRRNVHLACGLVFRGRSVAVSDVVASVKRLSSDIPLVPWNPDGEAG
jgi:hypothetical protein